MKFLAVLSAVLAVACASNTWTLQMLSEATTNPNTDPALLPYLEAALNDMVTALWSGQDVSTVTVTIPSASGSSMSLNELSEAIQNPNTDPALIPALEAALNDMMHDIWNGNDVQAAVVATPAMEIHYYTLNEVSEALQNPSTNPELVPYLEHALNEMMTALFAGNDMTAIVIAVPAAVTPVETPIVPIGPVVPVVVPEVPTVPETPASPSSPLVQIIVNIKQQESSAAVVPVAPVVVPAEIAADPVIVVDSAPVVDPIQVIDAAPAPVSPVQVVTPVIVDPVQVIEAAPAIAEPVIVAQPTFEV